MLALYSPLEPLQQKRLAARRHKTIYCFDFPAVFEDALRQLWAQRAAAGEPNAVPPAGEQEGGAAVESACCRLHQAELRTAFVVVQLAVCQMHTLSTLQNRVTAHVQTRTLLPSHAGKLLEVQELVAPPGASYRSASIPLTPVTRPASQVRLHLSCWCPESLLLATRATVHGLLSGTAGGPGPCVR